MRSVAPRNKGRPRLVRTPPPEPDEIEDMDDHPPTTGRPRLVGRGLRSAGATANLAIIQFTMVETRALETLGYAPGSGQTRSEALAARGAQKALVNAALELIAPDERNWPDSAREAVRQWIREPTRSTMPDRERLLAGRVSEETPIQAKT